MNHYTDQKITTANRGLDLFWYDDIFAEPLSKTWRMEKWNPESGTGTGQINEWFKLGSIIGIDINTPTPFSAFLARWMIIHERNE